jgi:hypothetical protein
MTSSLTPGIEMTFFGARMLLDDQEVLLLILLVFGLVGFLFVGKIGSPGVTTIKRGPNESLKDRKTSFFNPFQRTIQDDPRKPTV